MKPFTQLIYLTAIIILVYRVKAVPVEPPSNKTEEAAEATNREIKQTQPVINIPVTPSPKPKDNKDLEASNSNPQTTYVLPQPHSLGVTGTGAPTYDPTAYTGYLTPESFQQYLQQFAGAFAPYGYPGYGPAPVYPAPYAVQTGYDGFLIPSSGSTSLSASGTVSSNSGNNLITALSNLIPTLMDSTIFRVVITVIGAILMLLFGGAVTTAICNLTPLCDISFKAVTYLRGNGSANMGRMLAEEMTPERVKRATEFVRNAIRKYKELQKVMIEQTKNE